MIKKLLSLIVVFVFFAMPVFAKEKIEVTSPDIGIYVFKINAKKYASKIKPYVAENVETPKKVYSECPFDLVVNGGFFDVKTAKSVSFVTINGVLEGDINDSPELIESLKKQDRLDKVLSRGEFRVLENTSGEIKFDIARHNEPVEKGYHIKHALQAGPILLPEMDLEGEGFVQKENDVVKFQAVDILKRRERTAVALKGKYLYVVLFTSDYKVDGNEMREYLIENLKVKKALALDGGLSTALNYKNISIGSMGKYQRKVKSFLVIEK